MPSEFKADTSGINLESLWEDEETPEEKALEKERVTDKLSDEGVLVNPMTGELIDTNDIDILIGAAVETHSMLAELKHFGGCLRKIALKKAEGKKKTRYLRGKEKTAKLEGCGSVYPVGAILKEAWLSYPQYRDQYLRIDGIALKLTEFNKLLEMTTDDKAFESFQNILKRAVATGTDVLPTVKLENGPQE